MPRIVGLRKSKTSTKRLSTLSTASLFSIHFFAIYLLFNPTAKPKTLLSSRFSSLTRKLEGMSRKGGGASLQKDAPWRASAGKSIPKIHHSPVLRLAQTPHSNYALAVMKHSDPIGSGLATEAVVEAAGPECIVPGQITPIRLLGVKVWPIEVNLKFLEPVGKELKLLGKFMDDAVNLMNKSFIDR